MFVWLFSCFFSFGLFFFFVWLFLGVFGGVCFLVFGVIFKGYLLFSDIWYDFRIVQIQSCYGNWFVL